MGTLKRYFLAAYSYGLTRLKGRVPYLILHVNSVCNARCRMCFNWEGMKRRRAEAPHTLEDLAKLADSMVRLPQLTLSGGEPFLRDDIPEILCLFYNGAHTRFFTIPTNALLPNKIEITIDRFLKECPNGFLNFCLPFHGVKKQYDDILGRSGSYEKFLETLAVIRRTRCKHKNISAVLNFVMSKFNYSNYREVIDVALNEFADIPFGIALARGITHELDAVEVPIAAYKEAWQYLLSHKPRKGISLNPYVLIFDAISEQMCAIVSSVVEGKRNHLACKAGKNFLVIYDNGDVYPCELLEVLHNPSDRDESVTFCLGNLHDFDYNLKRLMVSEKAKNILGWLDTHPCACTWECAIYSCVVNTPKETARLGTRVLENIFRKKEPS